MAAVPASAVFVTTDKPAMMTGIDSPSVGCWKVTAQYRGNELSFIVRTLDGFPANRVIEHLLPPLSWKNKVPSFEAVSSFGNQTMRPLSVPCLCDEKPYLRAEPPPATLICGPDRNQL